MSNSSFLLFTNKNTVPTPYETPLYPEVMQVVTKETGLKMKYISWQRCIFIDG